jgi:ABC-type Na+ transport system ATPase subunit NatA
MVAVAMFLTLFLSKARTATTVGFAVFLVGVIVQAAAALIFSDNTSIQVQTALKFLPFCLLAKGMSDLGSKTTGDDAKGLRWEDRGDYGYFPLEDIYGWLLIDFGVFLGAALLWDFLFGGVHGESRVRTWLNALGNIGRNRVVHVAEFELEDTSKKRDDDVVSEENMVKSGKFAHTGTAIVLERLKKTFKTYDYGIIHDKSKDFTAVNELWLHVEDNQLFCLLGHNGAGKSTTISMLTGLLQPTEGDAHILGMSLRHDVDKIRKEMGVCPQFDILWNELTSAEHIQLFGAIKGLPASVVDKEAMERLKDVELTNVANTPAGDYSGGMKRRLSVAIALTGGPRIVYLDEPTTGMDPVSRRQVWNLLEKEKKKRLVVLSTYIIYSGDCI